MSVCVCMGWMNLSLIKKEIKYIFYSTKVWNWTVDNIFSAIYIKQSKKPSVICIILNLRSGLAEYVNYKNMTVYQYISWGNKDLIISRLIKTIVFVLFLKSRLMLKINICRKCISIHFSHPITIQMNEMKRYWMYLF